MGGGPTCLEGRKNPLGKQLDPITSQLYHLEIRPYEGTITPPKTNMEPENGPLEKEIPIGNHHFQVPC